MKKDSFIKGTAIVYICLIFIKVLSAVYVIPFYSIIGESGGILYSYAYNIYNIFSDISTSGIPVAISIIVSEYVALGKISEKVRIYSVAKKIICILSAVSFITMFTFAKSIAFFFIGSIDDAVSVNDVTLVIRVISFCVLIIPFLSVVKGYFQAHKYATSTSYSQVFEQIVRIFVILVGSYVAINILNTEISIGVSVALSGSFIGGIAALIYLKLRSRNNKDELYPKYIDTEEQLGTKAVIKRIAGCAIPLVIMSISADIYNLTDIKLITEGLVNVGFSQDDTALIASISGTWVPKICVIISAIANSLAATIIPKIMDDYTKDDIHGVNNTFIQGVSTVFLVTLPLAVIVFFMARPIYFLFYNDNIYGTEILKFGVVINTIYCVQLISNVILQSMKKYKIVYLNTLSGFVINALLDLPLVYLFDKLGFSPYLGASTATLIGHIVAIVIVFIFFRREFNFSYNGIWVLVKKIILPLILAFVPAYLGSLFIKPSSYVITFVLTGAVALASVLIYLLIMARNGGLKLVLGENITKKFKFIK